MASPVLRTGYYRRTHGYLNGSTVLGYWWSVAIGTTISGYSLDSSIGNVHARGGGHRGNGFALRGVALSLPAAQSNTKTTPKTILGENVAGTCA